MLAVAENLPLPHPVEDFECVLASAQLSQLKQLTTLLKCQVRVLTYNDVKAEQVTVCCGQVGLIVSLLQEGDSWSLLQHSKEAVLEKARKADVNSFPFRSGPETTEFMVSEWYLRAPTRRRPLLRESPEKVVQSESMCRSRSQQSIVLPSILNSTTVSSKRDANRDSDVEAFQIRDLKVLSRARANDLSQDSTRTTTARTLKGTPELESLSDLQVALESVAKQVEAT
jgi:hypothetical protein